MQRGGGFFLPPLFLLPALSAARKERIMVIRISKRLTGAALFLAAALFMMSGINDWKSLGFFMPVLYSRLLIGVAAVLVIQYFLKRGKDAKDTLTFDFREYSKSDSCRILVYFLMILAYYILISSIGFLTTTCLFLVASYIFLGVRSVGVYVASLLITGFLYCIFDFALNVNFPHGFLY